MFLEPQVSRHCNYLPGSATAGPWVLSDISSGPGELHLPGKAETHDFKCFYIILIMMLNHDFILFIMDKL